MSETYKEPKRYVGALVELDLDTWLQEGHPQPECPTCAAFDKLRTEAKERTDYTQVWSAAAEIRAHPHEAYLKNGESSAYPGGFPE
ncbi:hypothetical protein ACFYOA_08015 [Streptomyces iakyrus]|uniref:hypothetical protein n=1 Tax=Streptomyces iakyrus TaxID=68219 RepID=UPI0036A830A0